MTCHSLKEGARQAQKGSGLWLRMQKVEGRLPSERPNRPIKSNRAQQEFSLPRTTCPCGYLIDPPVVLCGLTYGSHNTSPINSITVRL
jgi:hypothetical protein